MNNTGFDLKNFKKNKEKGLFTFAKGENGTVKVVKKRVDENGDEVQPFEMVTSPEHFDDLVLDNKAKIIEQRRQLAQQKIQIAAAERDLDEREQMLDKDAADFRAEIEKTLAAKK